MSPPSPGWFARFLRLFERPRALPVIVALAALIVLPTLRVGFYSDDYSLLALIEHSHPALSNGSPYDLYRFVPGDRAELAGFIQRGPLPWFADPALKLHFFRPLSSLLLTLDHALWGRSPAGYHVTCVILYVALVLAAGLFYRAILGLRAGAAGPAVVTATLAAFVFALDAGHFQPVAWIAGRHLLVAALPAVIGLMAHVRFVRERWRPGLWIGPTGVVLSLLAGEAGLGAVVYWLAFDALGPAPAEASSARARLRASLPALVIAALYAVAYKLLGLGAAGSGAYLDPATDPLGFAAAAATRVPALLGDSFVGIPSELITVAPAAPLVVIGLAAAAAMFGLYRLARPVIPDDERLALRWLLPGAFVSLVLAAGGFPGSRLLVLPSLGAAFLVAVLLHRGAERLAAAPGIGLRIGRVFLVAVHLVLAPLAVVSNAFSYADLGRQGLDVLRRADLRGPRPRQVVILAASDPMVAFYPAAILALLDPGAWAPGRSSPPPSTTIASPAPARPAYASTSSGAPSWMAPSRRSSALPVPRSTSAIGSSSQGVAVTVLALDQGAPTAIEATFDGPLDDPALHLLVWRDGRLVRVSPPPLGASIDLPWSPGPFRFF
ncbi:MAG: hypothetical protein QM820_43670 [Minicystis sp.]